MIHVGPGGASPLTRQTITTVTQDAAGVVTSYSPGAPDTYVINTAQGADAGSDATIAWGRWVNGTPQLTGSGGGPIDMTAIGAEQGLHYVIGKPTPPTLPASGTANFTLLGATKPTFGDGSASFPAGTLTSTGAVAMAVEWGGNAGTRIGLDLTATMPNDGSYRIQSTGGVATPSTSELTTGGNSRFSGTVPVSVTGADRACGGASCQASVQGLFAGMSAERAGINYLIAPAGPPLATQGIIGAAAFLRSTPAFFPFDMTPGGIEMIQGGPDGFPLQRWTGINAITQDASGVLTGYDRLGDGFVKNTAQAVDAGGDALITWGRWTNGTPQGLGTGGGPYSLTSIDAEKGWHYLIGKPTPTLPATGTANFTLLGATKPTFGDGSAAFPAGTLTSTGAIPMAVEWGGNAGTRIGLDLTVTMPNDGAYRLQTTGGVATPSTSELSTSGTASFSSLSVPVTTTGGARACMGGACTGMVNGFFAGPNAERAGVGYKIGDNMTLTTRGIIGAAALKR